MTVQIDDEVVIKKRKYYFMGAKDYKSVKLFEPEKYGFNPVAPHTACWKGFVVYFKINDENELLIDTLEICDLNNFYPEINGISAIKGDNFYIYINLNLKLDSYSGKIIINEESSPFKRDISKNIILEIKDGKLIDFDYEIIEFDKRVFKKEYYYLTVKFVDLIDKEYNYISNDLTIKIGDSVMVERGTEIVKALVTDTGFYNMLNSPYPVDKTKKIIRKYVECHSLNLNEMLDERQIKLLSDIGITIEDREYNYDEILDITEKSYDKESELINAEKDGEYSDLADEYYRIADLLVGLTDDLYENNPNREYIYLSVIFDESNKEYYYLTENKDIEIGDYVLVDCNGKEKTALVVNIRTYTEKNVPYPLNRTKEIIKVLDITDLYKKGKCPLCGKNELVSIVYGLPTHKLFEASEKGLVVLGGCCIINTYPYAMENCYCYNCDKKMNIEKLNIDRKKIFRYLEKDAWGRICRKDILIKDSFENNIILYPDADNTLRISINYEDIKRIKNIIDKNLYLFKIKELPSNPFVLDGSVQQMLFWSSEKFNYIESCNFDKWKDSDNKGKNVKYVLKVIQEIDEILRKYEIELF